MLRALPATTIPALDSITVHLARVPGLIAAILFGSAASGRLQPHSDLDIALLFTYPTRPDPLSLLELRGEIEQLAQRDVDLVVLNDASPILAFEVVRTGCLLFCHEHTLFDSYIMRVSSAYADFKRIRQPAEEAVIQRRVLQ